MRLLYKYHGNRPTGGKRMQDLVYYIEYDIGIATVDMG